MTEQIIKGLDSNQDSLVEALESIKKLLAKSDSKLAAARKSIAIASNQTALGKLRSESSRQIEIPTLDDIVEPLETETTVKVSNISEQLSEKVEETLVAVNENIPVPEVVAVVPAPKPVIIEKHDPQVTLEYLDTLENRLTKTLHQSLMESVSSIETNLKNSISIEFQKIREQIKKD